MRDLKRKQDGMRRRKKKERKEKGKISIGSPI